MNTTSILRRVAGRIDPTTCYVCGERVVVDAAHVVVPSLSAVAHPKCYDNRDTPSGRRHAPGRVRRARSRRRTVPGLGHA